MDAQGVRAALYARVSTEEQAQEGYSLDAQMQRLEMYCDMEGWMISGRYIEQGRSGRNVDRPEYSRMMGDKDNWDVLLVLKMDRIHRNSMNFAMMMRDLERDGKNFCSIQEQFDTSNAMGRFVMDVMQRIAQLESEQIGERVKQGMLEKAMLGIGSLGGGVPYGYDIVKGTLNLNPDESYTVRAIYRLYLEGKSNSEIANSLNEASIPSKKGGLWSRQAINNILHNPVYAGYVRWNGVLRKGNHSAIIDYDTYVKVNGALVETN